MIGNILIAIGALAPAMAGSFVKLGLVDGLYLSELVGVVLMYIGFIQATTVSGSPGSPGCCGLVLSLYSPDFRSFRPSAAGTSEVFFTGIIFSDWSQP